MRQSATYTNVIDGNLVRTPKPLSKGKALILAREILGPDITVSQESTLRYIQQGSNVLVVAHSWETALLKAKDSPEARAWADAKILVDNETAKAVNSLRAKTIQLLKDGVIGPVAVAPKLRKIHPTGSKLCGCGRRISANKETCLGCGGENGN